MFSAEQNEGDIKIHGYYATGDRLAKVEKLLQKSSKKVAKMEEKDQQRAAAEDNNNDYGCKESLPTIGGVSTSWHDLCNSNYAQEEDDGGATAARKSKKSTPSKKLKNFLKSPFKKNKKGVDASTSPNTVPSTGSSASSPANNETSFDSVVDALDNAKTPPDPAASQRQFNPPPPPQTPASFVGSSVYSFIGSACQSVK